MSWLHGSQPPDLDSCQNVLAFTRRAACRTALPTPSPGSRHGATRKVGIRSFLEFHTQPLGCVHAYGVAQAGHSRESPRKGPLRRIPGRFEMRVARPHHRFSTVENRVTHQLCIDVSGNVSLANCVRRRTIAPRHSRRLCAAAGTVPSPFVDGREFVTLTYMHMRAKHRRDRKPIVSKLPMPSRHRSPTLSQAVCASRCSPITVSRWSKICPIDRPRLDWPIRAHRLVGSLD